MTDNNNGADAFQAEETTIPIIHLGNRLIVVIQDSLHDRIALKLHQNILHEIRRTGISALIMDISAVPIMDSYIARILNDIARNASLMGTRTVIVGMKPSIAITLVTMGMEFQNVFTALNLDAALEILKEGEK